MIEGMMDFEFEPRGDAYDYDATPANQERARLRVVLACDELRRALDLLIPAGRREFQVSLEETEAGNDVVLDRTIRDAVDAALRSASLTRAGVRDIADRLPPPIRGLLPEASATEGPDDEEVVRFAAGENTLAARRYYYDIQGVLRCCDSLGLQLNDSPFEFDLVHEDEETGERLIGSTRVALRITFQMSARDRARAAERGA